MLRAHVGQGHEAKGVFAALAGMSSHNRLIEPHEIAQLLLSCAQQPVIDGAVLHANLGQLER